MTVSDLIRRSDAMGAVQDHFNADGFKGYDDGQQMMDRIKALPSVEAVEVVRCKDCIRTKERDEYTGRLWCSIHRGYMEGTYYCADGLRREDGKA